MAQKPIVSKGTRDFTPEQVAKRRYITGVIQSQFKAFGFAPIETPSFEQNTTLLGKYGEEGDRLIFKILNSGSYLDKVDTGILERKDHQVLTTKITEKSLRYDLTVPFARYVVQHQNEIALPFKRYQIQPVWRADRPQKGRYREFYQCDADVVGSTSLWQEVEFIQLYDSVFSKLGLQGVTIKLNNRKILSGIAQVIGASDQLIDFTVALDKLDKIGKEGVVKELQAKGISDQAITKLDPLFTLSGTAQEQLEVLSALLSDSQQGQKGIEELTFVVQAIEQLGLEAVTLGVDVTLARGLNYYTGMIYEVAAPSQVKIGSIGGGGRYDDLTGIFGLKGVSGVGVSFGLDRIYLVLEELDLFPQEVSDTIQVLFINFGNQESLYVLKALKALRTQGISCELYPDTAKMKKQMNYANRRGVPYVVLVGEDEVASQTFTLKNMDNATQETLILQELINKLARG